MSLNDLLATLQSPISGTAAGTVGALRLAVALAVWLLLACAETWRPRRHQVANRVWRTAENFLLAATNLGIARLLPVLSVMGAAQWAEQNRWGLLHWIPAPRLLEGLCAVVCLDCVIYWQHVLAHRISALWQFHLVHHSDVDLDASSGLRFHPGEILFSLVVKCLAVIVLGVSPLAAISFEILLNATALFSHANLRLPRVLNRWLLYLLVTPDMHRIHHSRQAAESLHNYGFCLPWWDYWFGTYLAEPALPQDRLPLGVTGLNSPESTAGVWNLLRLPWRRS